MAEQIPPELERMVHETNLSEYVKDDITGSLLQDIYTFTLPGKAVGRTSMVKNIINAGTLAPIRQKVRRIPARRISLRRTDEDQGARIN